MLNPDGKTPYPEWARPFEATWTGDQWIVRFVDQDYAYDGLRLLRMEMHAPALKAAAMPDGDGWYVGLAD